MRHFAAYFLAVFLSSLPTAAQIVELSGSVKQVVRVNSTMVLLTHVRVIDGTGAAAVEDQNVVIEDGKISAIQAGADVAASSRGAVLRRELPSWTFRGIAEQQVSGFQSDLFSGYRVWRTRISVFRPARVFA